MYKKLIEEFLKNQGFPTEQEFNRLFPNLKELDIKEFCKNYDPEENNIISVIIEIITNDIFYVNEYWESDKSIDVELNESCSKKELDQCVKLLEDNGWKINDVKELYEDLEENLNYDKKMEIINKLHDYSYSELKTLIDKN